MEDVISVIVNWNLVKWILTLNLSLFHTQQILFHSTDFNLESSVKCIP